MTALRLLEHYTSTQGEGPRVGVLTQFIRFAGCNLKCASWPCDSEFAIDPKLYREEQKPYRSYELTNLIKQERKATGASNCCLTGGEPFLQDNEELLHMVEELPAAEYTWEAFTNGTFEIPEDFFRHGVVPVMDWKLPGSGEETWIASRARNLKLMEKYGIGVVKFTIADANDFFIAMQVWSTMVQDTDIDVFVGPVWGEKWGATDIVDLIKKNKVPWRLNIQVHQYIYGVNVRGT
jgi:7-carboxy-7-deazaguanine synthase